jgi:hypothetical protein
MHSEVFIMTGFYYCVLNMRSFLILQQYCLVPISGLKCGSNNPQAFSTIKQKYDYINKMDMYLETFIG